MHVSPLWLLFMVVLATLEQVTQYPLPKNHKIESKRLERIVERDFLFFFFSFFFDELHK